MERTKKIGWGVKYLVSFSLRKMLYKKFKKAKVHFVTLEMDEDQLRERLQNQFIRNMIESKEKTKKEKKE